MNNNHDLKSRQPMEKEKDSWRSDSSVEKKFVQRKSTRKYKRINSRVSTKGGNDYRRLDSTKRRKNRLIKAKLSKNLVTQFIEPASPDRIQKELKE